MPSERASENTWSSEDNKKPRAPRPPPDARSVDPNLNRRKYPRFKVDGASVNLQKDGLFTAIGLGKSNKGRAALDLSESGARVLITERLAVGTKIRLKIEMEKYQDSVEVEGVIRWCVPYKREFQAGIKFSGTDPSICRKIALMHDWFSSPEYKAVRMKRLREKGLGFVFPE